ncbi:putative chromatin regulator PHD family [Helianthus annuus]|uniref:Chromatin regulator PHD family n=2 Tax=Helianthus annuus TaxID=4232 RepID=A0A9K3E512_HELAN|nr:diacylglycerol kinase theta [Helianthus annuus]KAF5767075.1 putative chromatin regulator PHD family [Helianthus annuus]KAJ0462707.1 putative chromatin regulator PHD family [Helianthus annuus]KAJ0484033.1 putative chromatin regulator PHD family [Helianthus annuus]
MMNKRSSMRTSQSFQQTNNNAAPLGDRYKRSISAVDLFPTSPDQSQQVMHHFTHSHHPIALVNLLDTFTCSGCKERGGAGKRFACQMCDFQLHDFCALSPPFLKSHPLHAHHQLVFYTKPKTGGIRWPTCNVCGKATRGFMFRCNICHFQMHPCCAMLSDQINYPSLHRHPLNLLPPDDQPCGECNRKRSGRLYGCRVCGYHLHAVCAKDLIKGLKVSSEKSGVLGPAVRFASQAVIEFIGGLIDGIGEGVGEALVQNVTRSPAGYSCGTRRM